MNIYDIAEKSGVSIATVSRIINNKGNVSKATKQKVLHVMQEMGYTPNAFARALGLNSIKMVGVLCSDVTDTYYAKAVSVIENELRDKGYDAILCCTGTDIKDKKKAIDVLLSKRVDALILIGSIFQEKTNNEHIKLAAKKIPVIIVNGEYTFENTYSIACDEEKSVFDCVHTLHAAGHNYILYLYDTDSFSGLQKKEGFISGAKSIGIEYPQNYIIKCKRTINSVRHALNNITELHPDFSAVITSEDILGVGVIKTLTEQGLTVPKDVAVVGFNNSIIAQCSTPTLTSIDNKVEALCIDAVRTLLDVFDGREVTQSKKIASTLVFGESFLGK